MPSQPIRFSVLKLSLFVVALTLTGCDAGFDVTTEEHIARAEAYHKDGDLSSGAIELKNALQKEPDNGEARWLLGQFYLEFGDGASAEKELRRALELGLQPEAAAVALTRAALLQGKFEEIADQVIAETIEDRDPAKDLSDDARGKLLALRGHAFFGLGNYATAERMYDAGLTAQSGNLEALLGKAHLAGAEGKLESMRHQLIQIVSSVPDFAPAWSVLGDLERFEGNAVAAEEAYNKAIKNRFNNKEDLFKRAVVRISQGKLDEATSDINALKRREPRHIGIEYASGLADFRRENYAQARIAFQDVLNRAPNYMPANYYLGISDYMVGNLEQAEQRLSRFLNANPQSENAARVLGTIRLMNRDYAGAESVLRPVVARDPEDVMALNLLGRVAIPQGKLDEGVDYLRKVVALQQESADAHMDLGIGLLLAGEKDAGIQELETAGALDPDLRRADLLIVLSHLRAREFDKALEVARNLREKQPDSPTALHLVGLALLGKGEEDQARETFRQVLQMAPGHPSASHSLASLHLVRGDIDGARKLYTAALEHNPGHLGITFRLVAVETRAGRFQQAEALLRKAMEANPQALGPRLFLANYYVNTGRSIEAIVTLREVQENHSGDPRFRAMMGKAQLAADQPANAAESFERLVEQRPDAAQGHYLLGSAYLRLEDLSNAQRELQTAVDLAPALLPAKVMLARLRVHQGQVEEAKRLLKELQQTHPNHPEVPALEGWMALREGRADAAVAAYKKALARAQTSELIIDLARAQWDARQTNESLATLEQWLEKHPQDVLARFHLGNLYMLSNRHEAAQSAFAEVVERSPEHGPALNNLAWLLREKDPARALTYAERARQLSPADPNVLDTLGIILLEQGRITSAVRQLQQASEKAPKDLTIRFHLAKAIAASGDKTTARAMLDEIFAEKQAFYEIWEARSLQEELTN